MSPPEDLENRLKNQSNNPLVRLVQLYDSPYLIGLVGGCFFPFTSSKAHHSYETAIEISNVELAAQSCDPSRRSHPHHWQKERKESLEQYKSLLGEAKWFKRGMKTGGLSSATYVILGKGCPR
jgi:hypothetical protein